MLKWLTLQTAAVLLGFVIDFFVGDPHALWHPVAAVGKLIAALDKKLRIPNGGRKNILRGVWTVLIVLIVSTLLPAAALVAAWQLHPAVYFALDTVMCWQLVAARQLAKEAGRVQSALERGDVEGARQAVSYIVGRDTEHLDADGICRAAVETVAENTSDGVIAPLFYLFLFGAAGGFFYKAVNTMDSMLGYKNDKYLYFGRCAAKTDDVLNFLPSRLSALLMLAGCPLCALDAKTARRVFLRDRRKHDSPNSAQTESVCAGALGVQLAGDAYYGGVLHKKQTLGDAQRPILPKDIEKTSKLMYCASVLMLLLGVLCRIGVIVLCF